jgi:hypothetical protein
MLILSRSAVLGLYSVIFVLSVLMGISALKTLSAFPTLPLWRPDQLAQTGVAMALFMATAIAVQARFPVSWVVTAQVGIAGLLLVVVFLLHGFPNRSALVAVFHLLATLVFSVWNITRLIRRQT